MSEESENRRMLALFTRTPLHVGAGTSISAIDQPVQRERHTRFPVIPGSAVKGVLRDHLHATLGRATDRIFGEESDSGDSKKGEISFGDCQLVCFPVRSAKGSFAMVTSPLALSRLVRDVGLDLPVPKIEAEMACLAGARCKITPERGKAGVVLEEYRFNPTGDFPEAWESYLIGLLDDEVLKASRGRFVLLSDGDLSHFAEHACPVRQHVRINPETGTSVAGALFNEEIVPSETLFCSQLTQVKGEQESVVKLFDALSKEQLVQFGGKGTTGEGFCTVRLDKGDRAS